MRTIVIALLLAVSAVATAAAQDRTRNSDARLRPDTEFTFGDDPVVGDRDNPYGDLIRTPRRGRRTSLIRPRVHFVPEMMKSIENI